LLELCTQVDRDTARAKPYRRLRTAGGYWTCGNHSRVASWRLTSWIWTTRHRATSNRDRIRTHRALPTPNQPAAAARFRRGVSVEKVLYPTTVRRCRIPCGATFRRLWVRTRVSSHTPSFHPIDSVRRQRRAARRSGSLPVNGL